MSWRLGNSIRLGSQTGLQLWRKCDSEDINRAWENIKENIKISSKEYELKQHKHWFDEECLSSLDQIQYSKMQWLHDPNQSNVDNLNNVRREAKNKKKECLKDKIDDLETNIKVKNIRLLYRGISGFKKGYQPTTTCNTVKDDKGDLVADFHSILARWKKYFSQLFIVQILGRQKYTHQNH
jgi:hypothetical protein